MPFNSDWAYVEGGVGYWSLGSKVHPTLWAEVHLTPLRTEAGAGPYRSGLERSGADRRPNMDLIT